jgi:rubrerythrin
MIMSKGINFNDLQLEGAEVGLGTEVGQGPLSRRKFLAGSAAILAGGALMAAPGVAKAHDTADPPSDVDMLNFALTLEHLEATFYRQGLEKFGAKDIEKSGLLEGSGKKFIRRSVYEYLELIRDHEAEHVDTLQKVITSIGGTPVPPAEYNFETTAFTGPGKFLKVARLLENTGVSAYDGAIAHIETAELLTGGAQIATVEARHASYLNLITGEVPFPNTFDPPVAPQAIFDAAAAFITTPLTAPYPPYPTLGAFRDLLPTTVIGGIPTEGL